MGSTREDKNFSALPDYSPPLSTLPNRPNSLKVEWKGAPIDLRDDPYRHLLHDDELTLAANLRLGNLCCIVDNNGSAAQILPMDPMTAKWEAFGWVAGEIDGHDADEIRHALGGLRFESFGQPKVIVANTLKGKGVGMLEGHGQWHHRIPNEAEFRHIMEVLS